MKISCMDPELNNLNEDLTIALPNLSNLIDEDLIDLVFSHSKYCINEDISIQKIYELNYEDKTNERLVIVLFTHSEATDQVLKHGDVIIKSIRIKPIRFSKDILKTLDSKLTSCVFQIRNDTLLNDCLANNNKLMSGLKATLEKIYDADLIIKPDCFEVKRRPENQLKSDTSTLSNKQWFSKLSEYLTKYTETKLRKYEFKNNLNLNETNWSKLVESCETRYTETESINLTKKMNQTCTIIGLKELVDNEEIRIVNEAKKLHAEEIKHSTIQEYMLDTLTETQCKLLKAEKYIEWCQKNISNELEIKINLKSVYYKDTWSNIEKAKSRLWDLINSIKEEKSEIDFRLAEFLKTPYLNRLLSENNLNCLVEFKKENDKDYLIIKSINDSILKKLLNLIQSKLQHSTVDLNDNSIELIKNSKFNTFIKLKENELKQTNEPVNYLITVYLNKKQVYCTGEKLVVNRLENDIREFFESHTIYTKEFSENQIDIFQHENLKYLKLVKYREIDTFCDEIKNQLKINEPFKIEACGEKQNEFGFIIKTYKAKIMANTYYHDRLVNFLTNLVNQKMIRNFDLNSDVHMDVFHDPKLQITIENIEEKYRCVILAPLYQDLINLDKQVKPQASSQISQDKAEPSFQCYFKRSNTDMVKITVVDSEFIKSNSDEIDCFLVSIDKHLQPVNSISQVVFDKAGPKLNSAFKNIAKKEYNNMILDGILLLCDSETDLKAKSILGCVLPSDSNELLNYTTALVFKSLETVDESNFKTIAFTLYSTSKLSQKQIVEINIESILNHLADLQIRSRLKHIYLIEDKLNPFIINYLTNKSYIPNSGISLNEIKEKETKTEPALTKPLKKSPSKTSFQQNSKIKVIYGSIVDDNLVTDAIVNSTSSSFDLNTGQLSALVLKQAGNLIQNELNLIRTNNPAQTTKICVSSAGNLKNKKYIIHCVLPSYNKANSNTEFKKVIEVIMNEAVKLKLTSISFPTLGAGNLNYPKSEVPKMMYETIDGFFKSNPNVQISVNFVVYQNDDDLVKEFKKFFNNDNESSDSEDESNNEWRIINNNSNSIYESDSEIDFPKTSSYFSNFKQTDQECSLNFDKVKVRAYLGDITQTDNDVLFNPTDSSLSLDGKISSSIVKVGGQTIADDLKKFKSNPDDVIWTESGLLKCKRIVHVNVRKLDIMVSVFKALKETNDRSYQSITLPVIGTGQLSNDAEDSIKKILDAISTYVSLMTKENRTIHLKQINISIYTGQPEFLKLFQNELNKRANKRLIETNKSFISKMLEFISPSMNKYQNILNEKSAGDSLRIDSAYKMFRLISDNQESIDNVKKRLKEIAEDEMKTEEFKNEYIKKLDDKTKAKIENLCRKENTRVQWDKYLSRIVLIGRPKNLMKCFTIITNAIADHSILEHNKVLAELTAQKIQWEYKKDDKWLAFSIYLNNEIEKTYKSSTDSLEVLNEKDEIFVVNIKTLKQSKKTNPNINYDIRRTEMEKLNIKIRMPETWLSNKDLDLIDLDPNSSEYKQVLDQIQKSGFQLGTATFNKVSSIHRVQNKRLYIQYITHREEFVKKYSTIKFEQTLFHGTNEDCVEKIWKNGFNRSYAGKNATVYGKGVYFAKSATYSHHYTDRRFNKPKGHMFVVNVLVGKIEIGNSNLNVPVNADTTVDNAQNPSIFVIYHDAQAYPEYLLTYE